MKVLVKENQLQRVKKIVSAYVGELDFPGICEIQVQEDIEDGKIIVLISINLNYLEKKGNMKASVLAASMRKTVQDSILKSLGIYVEIASIGVRC
jgi:hypothetical protein